MDISLGSIFGAASAFITLGGAYHTLRKIQRDHRADWELRKAEIVQISLEKDNQIKIGFEAKVEYSYSELDNKIESLKQDLTNFKEIVDNELQHIREKQAGEIRVLGDKIEDLRTELRTQHGQLIQMLTKLIDKT